VPNPPEVGETLSSRSRARPKELAPDYLVLAQSPSMFSSNNARANCVSPLTLVAVLGLPRRMLALSL
jgi:hypothetical protein